MIIEIMSHKAIMQRLKSNTPSTAIIFIADSELDTQNFDLNCWERNLILYFQDITNSASPTAMSAEQAQNIKEFTLSVVNSVQTLIVSCPAGISRSPSIAAGIMAGLGQNDMPIWRNPMYSPNALCYKQMLQAFGKSGLFAPFKKHISKRSFKKALRR